MHSIEQHPPLCKEGLAQMASGLVARHMCRSCTEFQTSKSKEDTHTHRIVARTGCRRGKLWRETLSRPQALPVAQSCSQGAMGLLYNKPTARQQLRRKEKPAGGPEVAPAALRRVEEVSRQDKAHKRTTPSIINLKRGDLFLLGALRRKRSAMGACPAAQRRSMDQGPASRQTRQEAGKFRRGICTRPWLETDRKTYITRAGKFLPQSLNVTGLFHENT